MHLLQGQGADNGDRRLRAGVAAGVREDGNIGAEHSAGKQRRLKFRDDQTGKGARNHQQQQPGNTASPGLKDAGAEVGLVAGQHSGHLLNVLGGLRLHDVHDVIDGDNAHQTALSIYDGHGQKVVLAEFLGDGFLILQRGDGDDIRVHDLPYLVLVGGKKQVPNRHIAPEFAVSVQHEADADRLHIRGVAADALKAVLHRHVPLEVDELGGHDGAGRVLRILQNLVDALAHLRVGVGQDALDHVGRHFLHNVNGIVQIQLIQHFLQLAVGKAADQRLLMLRTQLDKDLRRILLGQQTKDQRDARLVHILHKLSNVRRLQRQQQTAQLGVLFSLQQIPYDMDHFLSSALKISHTATSSKI